MAWLSGHAGVRGSGATFGPVDALDGVQGARVLAVGAGVLARGLQTRLHQQQRVGHHRCSQLGRRAQEEHVCAGRHSLVALRPSQQQASVTGSDTQQMWCPESEHHFKAHWQAQT